MVSHGAAPGRGPANGRSVLVAAIIGAVVVLGFGGLGLWFGLAREEGSTATPTSAGPDQGTSSTLPPTSLAPVPDPADTAAPTGAVAYATPDGRVWVGDGASPAVEVARGAALGSGDQSAVALAPTGDVVAFVRADGSLVLVAVRGGTPTVVATDVALATLGSEQLLAWSPTGERIAYVAIGTEAIAAAAPRRDVPRPPGAFAAPLPVGVLGNVVSVVDRTGVLTTRIGNPRERNYIGVTASPVDEALLMSSTIPGSAQRYTLVVGGFTSDLEVPTVLSLDSPRFGPDGTYFVAVGPAEGRQELLTVSIEQFSRTQLAVADRICDPTPSPDGTRVAFGSGPDCERLGLVPTTGGVVLDVTPPDTPDAARFPPGSLGWSTDGRFVTFPPCRLDVDRTRCGGPARFYDPDTTRVVTGPPASTVHPQVVALEGEVFLEVSIRGLEEFEQSFLLDPSDLESLTEAGPDGRLSGRITQDGASLDIEARVGEGGFVTGQLTLTDPARAVDRRYAVLGRSRALGIRVVGISGVWITTEDIPFTSGRFDLVVRRR